MQSSLLSGCVRDLQITPFDSDPSGFARGLSCLSIPNGLRREIITELLSHGKVETILSFLRFWAPLECHVVKLLMSTNFRHLGEWGVEDYILRIRLQGTMQEYIEMPELALNKLAGVLKVYTCINAFRYRHSNSKF